MELSHKPSGVINDKMLFKCHTQWKGSFDKYKTSVFLIILTKNCYSQGKILL